MAHAATGSRKAPAEESREPQSREIAYRPYLMVGGALSVLTLAVIRWWQAQWWFPEGLDATTWEFVRYWMSLLYGEFAILTVVAAGSLFAYWRNCPDCDTQGADEGRIRPEHENAHIGKLWAIVAVAAVFAIGVSYFGEQDAAWHQVVVRDTTFTPSHIPLFFFTFPLLLVFAFQASWYAYRRLYHVYVGDVDRREGGIPLSFFLFPGGGLVLVANVAFNEFGHSTWITEELFVQPFHWPFAWATYFFFAGIGILFPTIPRFFENLVKMRGLGDRTAPATGETKAA